MLKRTFDIVVSLIGLGLCSPVLIATAAAIKLTSAGPVFYRGTRVGRHGKLFQIFKFRSMVINAERLGGPSTSDDDPRITRVGQLMRKCKLDELPQLLNVLCGQMSLVGPRPEVQRYVDMYTEEEMDILGIRPGITDWASIWNSDEGAVLAGQADPDMAYEQLIRPTKLKLQLLYARQHNVWVDCKIIIYTVIKIAFRNWTPREIRHFPKPGQNSNRHESYDSVTELPGAGATREQLAMLEMRYKLAGELAENKEVLEVACGPGIGLKHLAARAKRVAAGDYDPALVQAAQKQYGNEIDIRQLDATCMSFDDDSFDVVLLLEAIYYLPDPAEFIREAARVLRPGGKLLVCSANCQRPDFNPSPFTFSYLSARELQGLLQDNGFATKVYAAYPIQSSGSANRLRQLVRNAAVKLHLIPKSMKWKSRIKRLFFGKLQPLPTVLDVDLSPDEPLVEVAGTEPVTGYKVLYAVGEWKANANERPVREAA